MDIESLEEDSYEEKKESHSAQRIRSKSEKIFSHLFGNIYLDKVYQSQIGTIAKVFPDQKLEYKSRQIFFKFVGEKENYDLVILNEFNFFYFEGKTEQINQAVKLLETVQKRELVLTDVVDMVENLAF